MNLIQLRYFGRVVELRSVSKAARALNVSQPAVTRQIRLLEEELGVPLLVRHRRGVEPTEAGLKLATSSADLLQTLGQISSEVKAEGAVPAGTLRVGFPPSLGDHLVGAAVSRFVDKYDGVKIRLIEGYSPLLSEWLLADRLDFAVMSAATFDPVLLAMPFYSEQIWVIMSGERKPTRPYSLREIAAGHRLIQTTRSNLLRMTLEEAAAREGVHLDVVVEADAHAIIKDLTRRGVGAHISPYFSVGADLESGEFNGGPVDDLSIGRFIVHRRDRALSRAAREMIEMLRVELMQVEQNAGVRVYNGAILPP